MRSTRFIPVLAVILAVLFAGVPVGATVSNDSPSFGRSAVSTVLVVGDFVTSTVCLRSMSQEGSVLCGGLALMLGVVSLNPESMANPEWEFLPALGIITISAGSLGLLRAVQTRHPVDRAVDVSPHYSPTGGWGACVRVSF